MASKKGKASGGSELPPVFVNLTLHTGGVMDGRWIWRIDRNARTEYGLRDLAEIVAKMNDSRYRELKLAEWSMDLFTPTDNERLISILTSMGFKLVLLVGQGDLPIPSNDSIYVIYQMDEQTFLPYGANEIHYRPSSLSSPLPPLPINPPPLYAVGEDAVEWVLKTASPSRWGVIDESVPRRAE